MLTFNKMKVDWERSEDIYGEGEISLCLEDGSSTEEKLFSQRGNDSKPEHSFYSNQSAEFKHK